MKCVNTPSSFETMKRFEDDEGRGGQSSPIIGIPVIVKVLNYAVIIKYARETSYSIGVLANEVAIELFWEYA